MSRSIVRLLRPAVVLAGLTGATLVAAPLAAAAPAAPTTLVTGVVRAVDGAPLRDVTVTVRYDAVDVDLATTTTGTDGRYRVRAPQASGAQVQFLAEAATGGTSATGYADACFQGPALCQSDGPTLDLTGVGTRRVDVTLGRASVLRGRVTDSLGRGVGGLRVAGVITSIQSPARGSRPDDSAVTDVNGNWSFGRVDPLGWGVYYDTPGSGPLTPAPFGYHDAAGTATVAAGRTVVLSQTLTGLGAVAGTVTDQAGAPVADAYVVLSSAETLLTTTTGADGRFRLEGLPVGRYPVCVAAASYDDPCDSDPVVANVREFAVARVTVPLRRTS